MLKLTYSRKSDKFQTITVLGSEEGIADLYWQLTENYAKDTDGTGIGKIKVTDLDGNKINNVLFKHERPGTELHKNI